MLKAAYCVFLGFLFYTSVAGQITVQLSTLPNVGDRLLYRSIPVETTDIKIDNQVFQSGENLQWDFADLAEGVETEENYVAISVGTVADSFPEADLVIDFIGLKGFAKRNTTDISILGVVGDSVAGFNLPILGILDNPFIIRRAPFGFSDQFSTNTAFSITIDAGALDTIPQFQDLVNQLPGTTVDSLRVTLSIDRSEIVDGWGMISIPSGVASVLKVTQKDIVTTSLEIYAVTFAGSAWVNLDPFLPEEIQDLLSVNTTNHLFFSSDKKEVIAEFTMSSDSILLSSRYASDIKSSVFSTNRIVNLIDVSVYPNPVNDWVNIDINSKDYLNNSFIQVYNISGQLLLNQKLKSNKSRFNFQNYASGEYLITIRNRDKLFYSNLLVISN